MKKLDMRAVQALKTRLEEFPTRQVLRPYDVIAQLAETFPDVQGRGYDLDDLMSVLSESGITLARNTVRNYLSRALAERRDAARRKSSTHTAPTPLPRPQRTPSTPAQSAAPPLAANETAVLPPAHEHKQVQSVAHLLPETRMEDVRAKSEGAAAPESVLERARARSRSTPTHQPTPGSFKLRPDTQDL